MTTITTCMTDCKYKVDGTCSLESIDIDDQFECRQYEEADEE